MAKRRRCDFGSTIRKRRRELDLTQDEVALRLHTSAAFVTHLETGQRRPSDKMLGKLASVWRFDKRKLCLLAKPSVAELLRSEADLPSFATWDAFRKNEPLHRANRIATEEMHLLSKVAKLGEVQSERDFIFVLIAVRQAIDGSLPKISHSAFQN
jgi:transcriptional regulator with XRE-family HTH domain